MLNFVLLFNCIPAGDTLFWSDWQTLSLSRANKHDGGDLRVLKTLGVDDSMMGIRAVDLNIRSKCTFYLVSL